jgi:hypothetical protein
MASISVKLTSKELELLCALASDQLFRREFCEARLPGYKSDPAELGVGKKLIERLRSITDRAKRLPLPRKNGTAN